MTTTSNLAVGTPLLVTAPNFREAGGHDTADGRTVRTGLVYRADSLGTADAADLATMARLDLGLSIDLRSETERALEPDLLPENCELLICDVMGKQNDEMFGEIFADPSQAAAKLGGAAGKALMSEVYRRFIVTDLARAEYRKVFAAIAAAERPLVFHCSQGKDRTGWTSAVLLTLLGVPRDVIMADYLSSMAHLKAKNVAIIAKISERGFDPDVLRPMFDVFPEYLNTAFDAAEEQYGSVEGYVRDGLGVTDEEIAKIRERLLD